MYKAINEVLRGKKKIKGFVRSQVIPSRPYFKRWI